MTPLGSAVDGGGRGTSPVSSPSLPAGRPVGGGRGPRVAAAAGLRATTPLPPPKGRASYLGPRSVGHQDPGATSTALMFAALEHAVIADRSQRFAGGARRPVSGS